MKKLTVITLVLVILLISLPPIVMGEGISEKDALTLKRENLVLKLQLMEQQLTLSTPYQAIVKEIREIDGKLKAMEGPKDIPKPKEGSKP